MPYLVAIIVLRSSFLLTLGMSFAPGFPAVALLPRYTLGSVELYSVRIATVAPSSPAVGNKARTSASLTCISFFYSSFVETVVDFNR